MMKKSSENNNWNLYMLVFLLIFTKNKVFIYLKAIWDFK